MAVAVPLLMGATGASAAIGAAVGVSAGIVTAATGVLVAASGVGKKINKAASKVFGEELVSFANIAGGVFLAAGGDPGSIFGGGGSGGGALASAGGIDGMSAFESAASTAGQGQALVEPFAAVAQQADPFAQAASGFEMGSIIGNGPAAMDPRVPPVSQPGGMPGGGALKTASEWWSKQSDPTKAALIQGAGQVVSGAAQGYAKAAEMKDLREERRRREEIFNSGSRMNATYGPRAPVTRGG